MNQPPRGIQELIHSLEEGAGKAWLGRALAVLLALLLGATYYLTEFKNFSSQEAMDAAQLARNLSEGKGFTTQFIRPLSLHLVEEQARLRKEDPQKLLMKPHPDLANPPLYPALLAGWMKLVPFRYVIPDSRTETNFERYQPDVLIGWFNVIFLLILIGQVYFLARRLFDPAVAAISATLVYGAELMWKFTFSGQSTIVLMVLFMAVIQLMVALEQAAAKTESQKGFLWFAAMALLTGVIGGLGFLTRYSFGVIMIPVVAFLALWTGKRRWLVAPLVVVAFLAVAAPWVVRNQQLSGTPFGTTGYALYQDTPLYQDNRLERTQEPDVSRTGLADFRRKMIVYATDILQNDLPRLGGSYVTAFFLVGLLIAFNSESLQRLRWFILAALTLLIGAQAVGRTHLTVDSPIINSENLLVLLAPPVFMFGVSLFYLLLNRLEFALPQLRSLVISAFVFVSCLPLFFTILPPRSSPVAYPPYHPVIIQQFANYLKPGELMMSDMPWAVAWYGHRDCLWTTLRVRENYKEDFYRINDYQKPVSAVYLTPLTADAPLRAKFLTDPDFAWGRFYMDALLRTNMPSGFPLKFAMGAGYMTAGHLFITDRQRWLLPRHER